MPCTLVLVVWLKLVKVPLSKVAVLSGVVSTAPPPVVVRGVPVVPPVLPVAGGVGVPEPQAESPSVRASNNVRPFPGFFWVPAFMMSSKNW